MSTLTSDLSATERLTALQGFQASGSSGNSLLNRLSPGELDLLNEISSVMRVNAGTVLLRAGDHSEALVLVLSGHLVSVQPLQTREELDLDEDADINYLKNKISGVESSPNQNNPAEEGPKPPDQLMVNKSYGAGTALGEVEFFEWMKHRHMITNEASILGLRRIDVIAKKKSLVCIILFQDIARLMYTKLDTEAMFVEGEDFMKDHVAQHEMRVSLYCKLNESIARSAMQKGSEGYMLRAPRPCLALLDHENTELKAAIERKNKNNSAAKLFGANTGVNNNSEKPFGDLFIFNRTHQVPDQIFDVSKLLKGGTDLSAAEEAILLKEHKYETPRKNKSDVEKATTAVTTNSTKKSTNENDANWAQEELENLHKQYLVLQEKIFIYKKKNSMLMQNVESLRIERKTLKTQLVEALTVKHEVVADKRSWEFLLKRMTIARFTQLYRSKKCVASLLRSTLNMLVGTIEMLPATELETAAKQAEDGDSAEEPTEKKKTKKEYSSAQLSHTASEIIDNFKDVDIHVFRTERDEVNRSIKNKGLNSLQVNDRLDQLVTGHEHLKLLFLELVNQVQHWKGTASGHFERTILLTNDLLEEREKQSSMVHAQKDLNSELKKEKNTSIELQEKVASLETQLQENQKKKHKAESEEVLAEKKEVENLSNTARTYKDKISKLKQELASLEARKKRVESSGKPSYTEQMYKQPASARASKGPLGFKSKLQKQIYDSGPQKTLPPVIWSSTTNATPASKKKKNKSNGGERKKPVPPNKTKTEKQATTVYSQSLSARGPKK